MPTFITSSTIISTTDADAVYVQPQTIEAAVAVNISDIYTPPQIIKPDVAVNVTDGMFTIMPTTTYQEFASDFTGSLAELQQQTCEDFVADTIPVNVPCPTCVPDPEAVVIDWTTLQDSEAFLNKRDCV